MSELNVVFRVGDGEYAIPADVVLHMETFQGATRVPGTPPHVLGIVQVRGRVIPVVDLRRRFGLALRERGLSDRVLVVEHEGRQVGLLADSAREVVRVDADAFSAPPDLDGQQSLVAGVAELGGRLLLRIALDRLLGPAELTFDDVNVTRGRHGEQRREG